MAARVSCPGGRFWAISDLSDDELSGDETEEDTDRDAAPLPTIGDALLRARDLRGSRRKDKQERYVRLEERLRRCRELLQGVGAADSAAAATESHSCALRRTFVQVCADSLLCSPGNFSAADGLFWEWFGGLVPDSRGQSSSSWSRSPSSTTNAETRCAEGNPGE
jgi:hypothetical protein